MNLEPLILALTEKVDYLIKLEEARAKRETEIVPTKFSKAVKISDTARILGMATKTVYTYINEGKLETVKLKDRKTYVTMKSIDRLLTPK